jgi:hypothetical protein
VLELLCSGRDVLRTVEIEPLTGLLGKITMRFNEALACVRE